MGKVVYKYIEPPTTPEKSVTFVRDVLFPMLGEYWDSLGESVYNKKMAFNILTFIQMWSLGSLVVVVAYENSTPVGFLLGTRYVPLLYEAAVVQTELCYSARPEVKNGLYEYLTTVVGFMNVNELWFDKDATYELSGEWKKRNEFVLTRYVKE